MKFEYIRSDGGVFVDYSWEIALSTSGDVYPKWCLELFSTMYFDKGVNRTKLMTEKCIWFRLYEIEKVLTLLELEVDDKSFNHEAFWLLVGSLVHGAGSNERCQKRDMWIIWALEESRGINLAWVISEHLCKHDMCLKENILICRGHYVTKIARSLGYLTSEEVAKCLEPIECFIVPSSGYEIGGSSTRFHRDNDFDLIVRSEDCVASDDDDMLD
ncbi:hypothetical protein Tco_0956437 [Tanacetum coccineum]